MRATNAVLSILRPAPMRRRAICGIAAGLLLSASATAAPADLPKRVGACTTTTIKSITDRFGKPIATPDSGSAVEYVNGAYQISYSKNAALAASRVGDKVKLCLVSIPKGCPPGDDRGRFYKTTNLRTNGSWSMADAQHMCGGA